MRTKPKKDALRNHPALHVKRVAYTPMTDDHKLAVSLRHLLSLDDQAVYTLVAGSTVVYYVSPHMKETPEGGCARIVLAKDGKTRRIGVVGFDPR